MQAPQQVKFTNMSDFLKASPFDAEYNLNRTLTHELFYEHLFVREHLAGLIERLHQTMFNEYEPGRVVFLKGYAGNGKTTLLHTFQRDFDSYQHIYVDFQGTVSGDMKSQMNKRLRDRGDFDDTLQFILQNSEALKNEGFVSPEVNHYIASQAAAGTASAASLRQWMDHFTLQDAFASLFVHAFFCAKPKQRTIIYFDNLDAAPMEHISDTFLVYFLDAMTSATRVAEKVFEDKDLDFRNDYRFVFSLRDANDAVLNAALADRGGFERKPFSVAFKPNTFKDITEKRIQYLQTYMASAISPLTSAVVAILNTILHDDYFKNVFLPLFNYNYREVTGVLAEVIHAVGASALAGRDVYEVRGILLFGITQILLSRDFLSPVLTIQPDTGDGYCYIDRVILTVLINSTNYRRGLDDETDRSDPYGLVFLVKDLEPIYRDVGEILESIARCFLSHRRNRVHLLTVTNTAIENEQDFVDKYTQPVERALNNAIGMVKHKVDIKSIQVRANPAGFTCIRYILPHFEFYSSLKLNPKSLFLDPLERVRVKGDDKVEREMYQFERTIDVVLQQVQKHVTLMNTFFQKRYSVVATQETFPGSKYCFRHQGTVRLAAKIGQSHTIKIVTTHIDYIDHFRHAIIKNMEPAKARVINKSLIQRIRRYVKLLDQAVDRDIAKAFADEFDKAIAAIENSDYTNRTARIRLPRSTSPP